MKNDFGGNMPLLDERGRLFGKVNLIDAAVGAFALLLVPLAYAAYLLFKAPPPVVASVEPRIVTVPKGARLEVKGQNLRPFFRAYLGPTAVEYLFASPDRAVLTLPETPAGDYEVILYDEAQIVAKGGSVTVAPLAVVRDNAPASIVAIGLFNRLLPVDAIALKAGVTLVAGGDPTLPQNDAVEILGVRPPAPARVPLVESTSPGVVEVAGRQQVAAVVRLNGHLAGKDLMLGATRIVPGVELTLPFEASAPEVTSGASAAPALKGPSPKRPITLLVQRVYADNPTPLDLRVRFVTRPEIVAAVQHDVSTVDRADAFLALQPQVLSLRVTAELDGETKGDRREGRLSIVDALVRVPALRTVDGWVYDNKNMRPGVELFLDTPNWQMSGIVLSMEPRDVRVSR